MTLLFFFLVFHISMNEVMQFNDFVDINVPAFFLFVRSFVDFLLYSVVLCFITIGFQIVCWRWNYMFVDCM